jgi:hypothetical protein
MASDINIANRALQKLGAASITSFNDNSTAGRAMNLAYPIVRDAELRRYLWKFAIVRVNLPPVSTAPINGIFSLQYQLPAQCLRVLNVGDYSPGADTSDYRNRTVADYSIEGSLILTNIGAPLSLRYVQQITDPGKFDSAFAETFAARLAWETCEQVTQSGEKRKLAMTEYKQALMEAVRANALEIPPDFLPDNAWMLARIQ